MKTKKDKVLEVELQPESNEEVQEPVKKEPVKIVIVDEAYQEA